MNNLLLSFRVFFFGILMFFFVMPLISAAALSVKIVGPHYDYTSHDIATIAADLDAMLDATSGYGGSTATATVFSGQSLVDAFYHPSYRSATRSAVDAKYDYLVILPETEFYEYIPEVTFDGVLQLSRRALNAGTTPLLLMPRGVTVPDNNYYYDPIDIVGELIDTMGENSYRIANGCGIDVVPGGYAVNNVTGLSDPGTDVTKLRQQAYLIAATLFTKITGLNAATDTTYPPTDVGNATTRSSLAGTAFATVSTHETTNHYTTERQNSGAVRYRPFTPPNNRVRFLNGGTSTEQGFHDKLGPIITASGFINGGYKLSNDRYFDNDRFIACKPEFDAYPDEYLITFWRLEPFDSYTVEVPAQDVIDYNQANLMPFAFDKHDNTKITSGVVTVDQMLKLVQSGCEKLRNNRMYFGWRALPCHLASARLAVLDPNLPFSNDGEHMSGSHYNMMAAMMFISALGRDPVPPADVIASSSHFKAFNLGVKTLKELAFLSETMAFTPESSVAAELPAPLEKARWETFSHTFAATGGTAPYTWSESSPNGLPPGLSLSPEGVLSGAVTSVPATWKLVIGVKDSLGAIHKVPFMLNVVNGVGSLSATPTTTYAPVMPPNGPAPTATATYTLNNPGLSPINWTATKTNPWLTLSPSGGTLAAGASAAVVASINSNATSLAVGTHTDSISFTNTTSGFGNTTRDVSLRVSATPTLSVETENTFTFNSSSWTPAALNPVGWYDATDTTTITHVAGAVSEWRSKQGTSHMKQSTGAKQPLTGTSQINGLNAIAFDGTDDGLKTAVNPFGAKIDNALFMAVMNVGTIGNAHTFTLSGTAFENAKRWQANVPNGDNKLYFDCGGNAGVNRVTTSAGWSANQNKLVGFYGSITDNLQQIWESGNLLIGDTTGHSVNTHSGMVLGYNGTDLYDNCTMGEVVIVNGAVGKESRQRLEGYLAHKWGMTSTLPVDHPYNSAPLAGGAIGTLGGIIANDPDGDPMTYSWSVVSGPSGFSIDNGNSLTPSFYFTALGTYTLRLTVSDGYSQVVSSDVVVNVVQNAAPVANAGSNQAVALINWTPEVLNPIAWYDATDTATIFQSGGTVSEWRSKAGSSHMLQATSSKQPQTGTMKINGLNAIAFDGTNDGLKTAGNPFGSRIDDALFMAVMNVGTIGYAHTFTLSGTAIDYAKRWQANVPNGDNIIYFDCGGNAGDNRVTTSAGWSANQNKLMGFYCSVTDNLQQIWDSGSLLTGDTTGHSVDTQSGMVLGYNGTDLYDNCTMGEVVIVNGVVSNENRQRLEGYLAKKWGMTGGLPAGHPYKTASLGIVQVNLIGTASDTINDLLTYTWSVVGGPVGGVINNPNALNATLTTEVTGTYTLRLTVSDGFLQHSDEVAVTVLPLGSNPQSPYQTWSGGTFTYPFTITGATDDQDNDGIINLMEFAFGTDPTLSAEGKLGYVVGGNITLLGSPVIEGQPEAFKAVLSRRKDYATAGITYNVQYSADLEEWTASDAGLSVVTDPSISGDMEVVSVPFPTTVPLKIGGTAEPKFFRIKVTGD